MHGLSTDRWPATIFLLSLATGGVLALDASLAGRLRGLRMSLRSGPGKPTVAHISLGEIRREHERRGFFRIGVLPRLVARDVKLRVLEPEFLVESLAATEGVLAQGRKDLPLELRDFTLSFLGDETPRLFASRVQLTEGTVWRLSGLITWRMGTNTGRATLATLQVAGEQAGWLLGSPPDASLAVDLFADERTSPAHANSQ